MAKSYGPVGRTPTVSAAVPKGRTNTVLGSFTSGPKGRQAYGAAKGRNIQAAMKAHAPGKASPKKAGAGGGGGGG